MENKLQTINKNLKEKIKQKISQYKFLIKPFLCIMIIFAIAIIAIIRADYYYVDDAKRAAEGVAGWVNFSRYITEFLAPILHADTYLTDISPLPQLLAVCIMAITGVIVLYIYKNEKKFSIWEVIAVIPLGLSPYFLECLTFKYDAPYMALSVLASVVPLLFRKKKKTTYSIMDGVIIQTSLGGPIKRIPTKTNKDNFKTLGNGISRTTNLQNQTLRR